MAVAEEVNRFDDETIKRSIQCEFGQAADDVYKIAPGRQYLRGKITVSRKDYKAKEVGTKVGFLVSSQKQTMLTRLQIQEGGILNQRIIFIRRIK